MYYPFSESTLDIRHGEFPCWEKDCPISVRFICDDCVEDALEENELD